MRPTRNEIIVCTGLGTRGGVQIWGDIVCEAEQRAGSCQGAGKLRQKRSTWAAVMRATSMREGAFSSRLMVGCEHSARPLSGA